MLMKVVSQENKKNEKRKKEGITEVQVDDLKNSDGEADS